MSSNFFDPTQQLLRKDGSLELASHALNGVTTVLVYFAASWCEPCCEFAPMLKAFYAAHHETKSFEVVLLSFDSSEAAMIDYFKKYNGDYYCLPYADAAATRISWMEQFNVKGLPSLVVFKNACPRVVVTHYGVNMVVSDPEGVSFPWPETCPTDGGVLEKKAQDLAVAIPVPPGMGEQARRSFFDNPMQLLLRKDDSTVLADDALNKASFVLVYFSAQWCPHCINFTPLLKTFYDAHHVEKKFEVVFMSLDFDEKTMMEYFREAHGDYYCLPFDDVQAMKSTWLNLYNVKTIPTVLVFEKGYPRVLVAQHGRDMVEKDPDAQFFPWPDSQAVGGACNTTLLPWKKAAHSSRCWQCGKLAYFFAVFFLSFVFFDILARAD
ncbi:tryparedoxin-like protein [Lotmaria passim]